MSKQQPSLYNFLIYFVKKRKLQFFLLFILSLAWVVDNVAWPFAFKLLVDTFIAHSADKAHIWSEITWILVLWGVLWVGVDVMFRLQGFLMAYLFPKIEADIRLEMFNYVNGHSYNYFANNFAGNLSNKISDMAQNSTQVLSLIFHLFIPAFITLVLAVFMFLSVNVYFFLIILVWLIIHMTISVIGGKRCSRYSDIHATSRSLLTGKIVDAFTNIINVKSFAKNRYELDYVGRYQADEQHKNTQALIYIEKVKICLAIASLIFPGILMTYLQVSGWQHNLITTGDVVMTFNLSWNVIMVAWYTGMELPTLFKTVGVCQQALTVMQAQHDIKDSARAQDLKVTAGLIQFEKVEFYYNIEQGVFQDINVEIAPGSKVGLVGFSGSGKSTFVNLMLRFYDIIAGSIKIDGQATSDVTLESLRNNIAMVPQNPTLFHRSIGDNIAYGCKTAGKQDIINAAKEANCHDFIMELPEGYDSLVGERGIKLSGGQRQRIAIARAILKNAPILILDEATSALDSVTEHKIQQALNSLMQNRTTIVVAHRLSTLAEMNRILVFDSGEIIEDGTHQQLLALDGHYAKMWHMQAGGFLPEAPLAE